MKKIKSLTIARKEMDMDGNVQKEYTFKYQERDPNGNVTLKQDFDDLEQLKFQEKCRYMGEQLVRQEIFHSDTDSTELFQFEYDLENRLIKTILTYEAGGQQIEDYTYEPDKVSVEIHDEDGEAEGSITQIINAEKQVTEEAKYDEEGVLQEHSKFKYLESGLIAERAHWSVMSGSVVTTKFEYNEIGERTSMTDLNEANEIMSEVVYTYDEEDQLIEIVFQDHMSGQFVRSIYEYDAEGKEIIHEDYDASENMTLRIASEYNEEGYTSNAKVMSYGFQDWSQKARIYEEVLTYEYY